jgi:Na+/proline symporter
MDAGEDFKGLAAVVLIFIAISAIVGFVTILKVKGEVTNFFVAGRSLPFYVVFATLGSQLFDSSSALGNLDLGYTYHWWDGGAFPIGLGLSLILNGIFFAAPLNKMRLLTLPDVFARTYGKATEILASLATIVSFLFLLAGNLVGC